MASLIQSLTAWLIEEGGGYRPLHPFSIIDLVEVQHCAKEGHWSTQIPIMSPQLVKLMGHVTGYVFILSKPNHACIAPDKYM
jgi:hypothetical protein